MANDETIIDCALSLETELRTHGRVTARSVILGSELCALRAELGHGPLVGVIAFYIKERKIGRIVGRYQIEAVRRVRLYFEG